MEVDRWIAAIIGWLVGWRLVFGAEALQAGGCLDQRAIYREVLIRQQPATLGSRDHQIKEALAHAMVQQSLPILGKGGPLKTGLDHRHPQEPTEQEVVVQLLTEGPFAADRVQAHQQRCLQQLLGQDRRTTDVGVHRVEQRRQLGHDFVSQSTDRAQRMIQRNTRLHVDERQHAHLWILSSAHSHHLSPRWSNATRPPESTGRAGLHQIGRFSPNC